MFIIKNRIIPFSHYKAMTVWPFIFVRKGKIFNAIDENHERIHGEQQKELLVIGFLLFYIILFLLRLIHYRNWNKAYCSCPFETEAYFYQTNLHYLEHRRHYAWRKSVRNSFNL